MLIVRRSKANNRRHSNRAPSRVCVMPNPRIERDDERPVGVGANPRPTAPSSAAEKARWSCSHGYAALPLSCLRARSDVSVETGRPICRLPWRGGHSGAGRFVRRGARRRSDGRGPARLRESVGPRGELASYALGWTTGSEPHVGRLSIGIGVGNPGGGTFHAVIFQRQDGHALSLTDERFEQVPQGGPHLSADQARAHEDLPFVWWAADRVMERDRRARWMRHWLLGTAVPERLDTCITPWTRIRP
jgi:hypothetical protein